MLDTIFFTSKVQKIVLNVIGKFWTYSRFAVNKYDKGSMHILKVLLKPVNRE